MAATTLNTAQTGQQLATPHGGDLCDLIPTAAELLDQLRDEARSLPKLSLSQRQVCDLELLLNGGFSPLRGFLNKEDYERYTPLLGFLVTLFLFLKIAITIPHSDDNLI